MRSEGISKTVNLIVRRNSGRGISHNWLMPCSIRDHYEVFRNFVLPKEAKPEDQNAREALESDEYFEVLRGYDEELQGLTEKIWHDEYLSV